MESLYLALLKIAPHWVASIINYIFKQKPFIVEEVKKHSQILFIDNDPLDSILENIRQSGWNVRQIYDVKNIYAEEIKNADIIFVDYKDIGLTLTPTEEGIGILKYLRRQYPKKHLIFLSGYAGFIPGHEIQDIVDGWIQKNADPYVYIERIETATRKMYERK